MTKVYIGEGEGGKGDRLNLQGKKGKVGSQEKEKRDAPLRGGSSAWRRKKREVFPFGAREKGGGEKGLLFLRG